MASRSTLSAHSDTNVSASPAWPDGCMPGHVAPFVMRYGVEFLKAMQAASPPRTVEPKEAEPA